MTVTISPDHEARVVIQGNIGFSTNTVSSQFSHRIVNLRVVIDGQPTSQINQQTIDATTEKQQNIPFLYITSVSPGTHIIELQSAKEDICSLLLSYKVRQMYVLVY